MNENLIDLNDLMIMLGYEDERSLIKWCKLNQVPILKMGIRKYTLKQFLTQHIERQLIVFAKENSLNPDLIIEKVREYKIPYTEATIEEKEIESKESRSEATVRFLKNIKAA